jgi:protein ImuA
MLQAPHSLSADVLALAPEVEMARARAHEMLGPSRVLLALLAAARLTGPVLWLRPEWAAERLTGDGMRDFVDPGRVVFGRARRSLDILWAAEEALRSGQVPLVVAELPEVPGLVAVRRLHLAAENAGAPLALLLTPEPGGAPGVETRWRLAPAPGWAAGGDPRWRLTRARARLAPEKSWEMRLEEGRLVLSPAPS